MTADTAPATGRPRRVNRLAERLPVFADTLSELRRRRLVPVAVAISIGFIGLFAIGFSAMYSRVAQETDAAELVAASSILTVLAMFVVHLLTALLALFVSAGAVSGPRSSGLLLPVLARPLGRRSWLMQRLAAMAVVVVGYPVLMTLALLAVSTAVGDYAPVSAPRAVAVLVLEGLVLVALAVAASSRLSTVVSGVVVVALVGMAWLAGLVEVIGAAIDNAVMRNVGVVVSLIIPTDALWRGASYYLQSPVFLAANAQVGDGIPFAGSAPPTIALLVWSTGYALVLTLLAIRWLRRTDL